jgi:chromosome partitioning protein
MVAKVISSINMKGGVGKTTLTVNLAASLAHYHNKRVLVVDLDPQTNATFSLIKIDTWNQWVGSRPTLADLMKQTDEFNLSGIEPNAEEAIIKNVGRVPNLDLIPSHLKLTYIDIQLAGISARERILKQKLSKVINSYDFIFCDCPPNLSISTQNGLAASDYYIIPVVPEVLAALGLGLIDNRIKQLSKRMEMDIKSIGIIFTRYDRRITETERTEREIIDNHPYEYIFTTKIPENVSVKTTVRDAEPIIICHPRSSGAKAYKKLAEEFLERLHNLMPSKMQ